MNFQHHLRNLGRRHDDRGNLAELEVHQQPVLACHIHQRVVMRMRSHDVVQVSEKRELRRAWWQSLPDGRFHSLPSLNYPGTESTGKEKSDENEGELDCRFHFRPNDIDKIVDCYINSLKD